MPSSAALVEISDLSNGTLGTSFVELLRKKFPVWKTRRRQKRKNKTQLSFICTYFLCQQRKVPKKLPSGHSVFDICIAHHRQNNSLRSNSARSILFQQVKLRHSIYGSKGLYLSGIYNIIYIYQPKKLIILEPFRTSRL